MSDLLSKLRDLAVKLPPSHLISLNELAGVVSAIAAVSEHGEDLLKAAEQGEEHVHQFFTDLSDGQVQGDRRGDAAAPGGPQLQATGPNANDPEYKALMARVSELEAQLNDQPPVPGPDNPDVPRPLPDDVHPPETTTPPAAPAPGDQA